MEHHPVLFGTLVVLTGGIRDLMKESMKFIWKNGESIMQLKQLKSFEARTAGKSWT